MTWVRVIKAEALRPGTGRRVTAIEEAVLLCRAEGGEIFGVADRCSHDGASFDNGKVSGTILECPRHGAQFDLSTGRPLRMPAVAPIETFPIRVTDDGWVEVDVEEE